MTEPRGNGELAELAAEIDEAGERASRTVELGRRGFTIAVFTDCMHCHTEVHGSNHSRFLFR